MTVIRLICEESCFLFIFCLFSKTPKSTYFKIYFTTRIPLCPKILLFRILFIYLFIRISDLALIDSVIRVLQNMDECEKRSVDSLKKSQTKECEKLEIADEDFHLKILKDICCELLSNMLQELSEVKTKII